MQERRFPIALCSIFFVLALVAGAQDDQQPSLGDLARQARHEKQQRDTQPQVANAEKEANPKDVQAATPPAAQIPTVQSNKDVQNGAPSSRVQNAAPNSGNQNKNQAGVASPATAPGKPPKHVITNDEIPSEGGPTGYRPSVPRSANEQSPSDGQQSADGKASAEEWTAQIASQKSSIANLQSQIDSLSSSIQYAGANCVANCEQWNEAQKKKQDQVDAMKAQLDEAQKHLEEMQEQARQQGYGSSVYEP
jgi:hypothetical protein